MCELLAKMADQTLAWSIIIGIFGILTEYFPILEQWEAWKKASAIAGIGIVLPMGAYFIGVAQACWPAAWGSAEPFVLVALWAVAAAFGGVGSIKGGRAIVARTNK